MLIVLPSARFVRRAGERGHYFAHWQFAHWQFAHWQYTQVCRGGHEMTMCISIDQRARGKRVPVLSAVSRFDPGDDHSTWRDRPAALLLPTKKRWPI